MKSPVKKGSKPQEKSNSNRIRQAYLFQNKGNVGSRGKSNKFLNYAKKQPSLENRSGSSRNGSITKSRKSTKDW